MADIKFNHLQKNYADRLTEMCTLINQQISLFEEKQCEAINVYNDLVEALVHGSIAHYRTNDIQWEGEDHMIVMQEHECFIVDQFSSFLKCRDEMTNQLETNPDSKDKLVSLLENTESLLRASIEKWEKSIAGFEKFIENIKRDYFKKACMNCKSPYIHGDKYCRYCGAPMGTPIFILDDRACIYGPMPVSRTHECTVCGYSWVKSLMIDKELWCPMCGGKVMVSDGHSTYMAPDDIKTIPDDIIVY